MKQDSKEVILKSLFEGHINEAKQAIHVVKYTWDGVKVAELVCYTNTYNKLKKLKGYKELDHTQLEDEDSPQRFYNIITDEIKKNGLDKSVSGGYKVGKENSVGYGYVIYNSDINDLID